MEKETCKSPKILGENLDPADAIDIRAFNLPEQGSDLKCIINTNFTWRQFNL